MGKAAVVEVRVGGHLEDGWNLICGTCKPRNLALSSRGETFVQELLFIPGKHDPAILPLYIKKLGFINTWHSIWINFISQ